LPGMRRRALKISPIKIPRRNPSVVDPAKKERPAAGGPLALNEEDQRN